jgi:hypothetical protein
LGSTSKRHGTKQADNSPAPSGVIARDEHGVMMTICPRIFSYFKKLSSVHIGA